MKIIEAMKLLKNLAVKVSDLRLKIAQYCVDYEHETPTYGTAQQSQVNEWLQSASDTIKEMCRLRVAIQRTNIATPVTIELGGKTVTKTIAEWIHRRRDLANLELEVWSALTDRNLKEGSIKTSTGEVQQTKIRRYYDPFKRDQMREVFRSEPSTIDATLEVVNAVTDLIE